MTDRTGPRNGRVKAAVRNGSKTFHCKIYSRIVEGFVSSSDIELSKKLISYRRIPDIRKNLSKKRCNESALVSILYFFDRRFVGRLRQT